jgi:hypothetical protein
MCRRIHTYWQPRHPGCERCGGGYIDVEEDTYLLAASALRVLTMWRKIHRCAGGYMPIGSLGTHGVDYVEEDT